MDPTYERRLTGSPASSVSLWTRYSSSRPHLLIHQNQPIFLIMPLSYLRTIQLTIWLIIGLISGKVWELKQSANGAMQLLRMVRNIPVCHERVVFTSRKPLPSYFVRNFIKSTAWSVLFHHFGSPNIQAFVPNAQVIVLDFWVLFSIILLYQYYLFCLFSSL